MTGLATACIPGNPFGNVYQGIRLATNTDIRDVKSSFATVLRACRGRLGISQEELGARAGLHRTYVSDIERGARNLSLESIEKLARALEIPVSTLFSRLNEPSQSGSETFTPLASDELVDILLVEGDRDD